MFSYEGSGVRAALEGKRKGDPILPFNNEIFIKVLQTPMLRKGKDAAAFSHWERGRWGRGCTEGVVVVWGGAQGRGTLTISRPIAPQCHAGSCRG